MKYLRDENVEVMNVSPIKKGYNKYLVAASRHMHTYTDMYTHSYHHKQ